MAKKAPSLSNRIFFMALIPTLLTLICILAVVFVRTISSSQAESERFASEITKSRGFEVKVMVEKALQTADDLATVFTALSQNPEIDDPSGIIFKILKKTVEQTPKIYGIWMILEPGYKTPKDKEAQAAVDPKNHFAPWWMRQNGAVTLDTASNAGTGEVDDYYTIPRDTGKTSVIEPTDWKLSDGTTVLGSTVVVPIQINGVFQGVVGVDFLLSDFHALAAKKSFINDYSYIMSHTGIFITHPKTEVIGKTYQSVLPALDKQYSVSAKIAAGKPVKYYDKSLKTGAESLVLMEPVFLGPDNVSWTFGITVPVSEISEQANGNLLILSLISLAGILILVLVSFILRRQVIRPIGQLTENLRDIALGEGDLTKRMPIPRTSELGQLGTLFNEFISKLAGLISQLKEAGVELDANGKALDTQAAKNRTNAQEILGLATEALSQVSVQNQELGQVDQTLGQMNQAIGSLKTVISDQAASVTESSASIEEMVGNIKSVDGSVNKIGDSFSHLVKYSESGIQTMATLRAGIAEVQTESENLMATNKVISTIAAQTNLLAMNAAIEAAHAGDSGRGFSVVADEVRKLAESASLRSKETTSQLKNMKARVATIVESSLATDLSFQEIAAQVAQVNSLVLEVRHAMTEQSAGSGQILEALNQIHQVTGQVMKESGKMDELSEQVKGALATLRKSSQSVTQGIQSMEASSRRIEDVSQELKRLGQINSERIGVLKEETERFKV